MPPNSRNAPPRKRRVVPVWKRPNGPVASFVREGDRAHIDFEYTPGRVAAVKAIKGARYDGERKSWSVPYEAACGLLPHKEFPATNLLNGLGPAHIAPLSRSDAVDVVRKNPFAVPEEAIAALGCDLTIRMNDEKRRLRAIPRLSSPAHALLKKITGVTFSGSDGAYVVPTELLASLVKQLRDVKLIFAIEQGAGEELSASAELRNRIIENPQGFSGNDLSRALLTPFVTEVRDNPGTFRLCFFTVEQFNAASLGTRRGAQQPFILDHRGLLSLSARLRSIPFTVWLSREVHQHIANTRAKLLDEVRGGEGPLEDDTADLVEVPLVWRMSPSGRAALALTMPPTSETRAIVLARIAEVLATKNLDDDTDGVVVEVPDSKLPQVVAEVEHLCEVHSLPPVPRSVAFDRFLKDCAERLKQRERTQYYTSLEDVPAEGVRGLDLAQARRLFPHQRVAVEWLRETPHAFLGDDMGLGKTLSVLSYFATLRREEKFDLLLVVCPNSLTRNWVREAGMWFSDLRAIVVTGDKATKSWTLRVLASGSIEAQIVVVNYEGVRLPYVTPELDKLVRSKRTLLCLDESQRVKNHQAKTFKALAEIAPGCERRVLLSGTPTPKDPTDVWAQMRILDGGKRLGTSYYRWLESVAELGTEYSEYAVRKFNDEAVKESILRVHEVMVRRRKERVVDLPEKTFTVREIQLTGSQKERYDEIRDDLLLRMRSISGEQFVREITNILEQYLRAVQVASNPRLLDPEWKGDPAKFLELDEIVNEVVREQGQKIVIWSNYLGTIRELAERYSDLGSAQFSGEVSAADREKIVRGFQESDTPRVLVAVPAAGGVGITLTAAQTAVYVDKTWNAEHWMQSVDRLHRIGQRGTVSIISLLGCKVDEIIHWNLRRKEQKQAVVLGDTKEEGDALGGGLSREELLEALSGEWG